MKKKVQKKQVSPHRADETAASIFSVATKLFAEKGFDGVSTKEICTLAKANISSLHYHFETKEKLYFAIVSRFTEKFQETVHPIFAPPKNAEEMRLRLELFLENLFTYFSKNQELSQIIYHEMGIETKRSVPLMKIFLPTIERTENFFKEAHKSKIIFKEIDPKVLTWLFLKLMRPDFGEVCVAFEERFSVRMFEEKSRNYVVKSIIQILLDGILPRDKK